MPAPNDELQAAPNPSGPKLSVPFAEFVALIALMMALTALSIDIMLPSLPQIDRQFALLHVNDRQLVITSYFIGFAPAQLVYGALSDRFGRRRLLFIGLAIYLAGTLMAVVAGNFSWLLAARALMGLGAAGPRVIAVAMVRDLFAGRQMARVMSMAMMVFITLPVFAPSIGQALMHFGRWPLVFVFLAIVGLIAMLWAALRLPETRGAASPDAEPLGLMEAARLALANPQTRAYTIAGGFVQAALMSYIVSAQQMFVDVFDLGERFPLLFGGVALVMIGALFTNARLVQQLGMRRLSHLALAGFIVATLLMVLLSFNGKPPLVLFCLALTATFFQFQLIVPNFNAIAMQPMGRVAGMASSLIGAYTTGFATLVAFGIGRLFDGTVRPLSCGLLVLGCTAMAVVVALEGRGGMFRGE